MNPLFKCYMTDLKEHCYDADRLFDGKTAAKQYKRYLKNSILNFIST